MKYFCIFALYLFSVFYFSTSEVLFIPLLNLEFLILPITIVGIIKKNIDKTPK